jgi:alpha(1,3/1,4) fucosyltransferase
MRISIIPSNSKLLNNNIFLAKMHRDDCFSYIRSFKEKAEKRGWEVGTFDIIEIDNADKVMIFGLHFAKEIIEAIGKVGIENMIAVFQEPPDVEPLFYDKDIHSCFGCVLLPDNTWDVAERIFYHGFPVSGYIPDWVTFEKRKMLVSISSWKTTEFPGGLYAERIRAIKYFQRFMGNQFDIYGQGWVKKTIIPFLSPHRWFNNYRGPCASKIDTMRNYKFSICYENSNYIKGYITEKLFDSFQAGCVPIYLGAPDVTDYIPNECFIDRRSFKSHEELAAYIMSIDKNRFERYLVAINKYIESSSYKNRLPSNFATYLIGLVDKKSPKIFPSVSKKGLNKLIVIRSLNQIKNSKLSERLIGFISYVRYGDIKGFAKTINNIIEKVVIKIGLDTLRVRKY